MTDHLMRSKLVFGHLQKTRRKRRGVGALRSHLVNVPVCLLPPDIICHLYWGVLDIEDSVIERSDEFFSDLCLFRSLNKSECVHSSRTELSETPLGLSALNDEGNPEVNLDTHQCAFWYRMNSRLFPVSLHTECCIVCKKHKTSHPHTLKNPALVRVSIPRAAVLPPYKFRAHRRRSFNTDSLGLPSHCLAGWSNRSQNTLAAPSSLDLRSNVNEKEGFSKRRASNHQVSDAPLLVPHTFQDSPKKKKARQHF
ncbi:migration and invasion-inhibitory protein isoform X2 [Takifugu flavidus]|uniref:migration and invasion-inhibitory protein isoform X2 n=1 Tax=Takifugu flavidus TaxID=433684 RepID=UPI002544267B|nr:migration and invasion-inhibitory protein isoform X2 [Takifugu flavidus]